MIPSSRQTLRYGGRRGWQGSTALQLIGRCQWQQHWHHCHQNRRGRKELDISYPGHQAFVFWHQRKHNSHCPWAGDNSLQVNHKPVCLILSLMFPHSFTEPSTSRIPMCSTERGHIWQPSKKPKPRVKPWQRCPPQYNPWYWKKMTPSLKLRGLRPFKKQREAYQEQSTLIDEGGR